MSESIWKIAYVVESENSESKTAIVFASSGGDAVGKVVESVISLYHGNPENIKIHCVRKIQSDEILLGIPTKSIKTKYNPERDV